jgi:hypothetical protein
MSKHPQPPQDSKAILGVLSKWARTPRHTATPESSGAYPIPPSRRSRKALTTWQVDVAVRQLKTIALEQGWTQQRALAEALNLLFAKHGKATIAR